MRGILQSGFARNILIPAALIIGALLAERVVASRHPDVEVQDTFFGNWILLGLDL